MATQSRDHQFQRLASEDKNLVICGNWLRDVLDLDDFRRPVSGVDRRFHAGTPVALACSCHRCSGQIIERRLAPITQI
jgi:hypothetical protein